MQGAVSYHLSCVEGTKAVSHQRFLPSFPTTTCSWIILGFSIVTFALAVTAIAHCSFVRINNSNRRRLSYDWNVGLFGYEEDDAWCTPWKQYSYDTRYLDPSAKLARIFGVLAALLTGLAMVYVVLTKLLLDVGSHRVMLWQGVRIVYAMAFVSQSLTCLAFDSDLCNDQYTITILDDWPCRSCGRRERGPTLDSQCHYLSGSATSNAHV